MAMPMISITGIARRIESGTDQSISTAPQSPNQVCASGVRTSSAVPQAVGLGGIDRDGLERDEVAEGDGAEGAQHEQRAVGEVDDAERAEDQRQAERDQRVGAALVEAVEQLREDRVHGPPACSLQKVARPGRREHGRDGHQASV